MAEYFQTADHLKTRFTAIEGYLAPLPVTQSSVTMKRDRLVECAWCTTMFSLMVLAVFAVLYGFFVLAGVVAANAQAQTAEELFRQAQRIERTSGDYASAIETYRAVYEHETANRELRADALLHLGLAYESLGRTEAKQAFETLLAEYADFDEVAKQAREGIARTSEVSTDAGLVQFIDNKAVIDPEGVFNVWGASLSPSGENIVAVSPDLGNPLILNLASGQVKQFGPNDASWGYGAFARLSPDGRQLAYSYWAEEDELARIRFVDTNTGEEKSILDPTSYIESTIGSKIGRSQVEIHDWSDDGENLLVVLWWRPEVELPGQQDQMMVMMPTNGAVPKIVGDRDTMWNFSWGKACLSGNDRFVMAEFYGSGNGQVQEIRRIDLESGEITPWRYSDGKSFGLLACANETGKVVYNAKMLSSNNAFVGDPSISGSGDGDKLLFRMTEEQYGLLGSRRGDVSLLETGYKNHIDLLSVVPVDHTLGEKLVETMQGWVFGWDWSADGSKIIYSRDGRKLGIAIDGDWTPTDLGFEEQMVYPRWLADQRHIMAYSPTSESGQSELFLVDTEGPAIDQQWSSTEVPDVISWYNYPSSVLRIDRERGCVTEGKLGSLQPEQLVCVGSQDLRWLSARYSPDGRHIRLTYMTQDSTRNLSVMEADGSGFKNLISELEAGNSMPFGAAEWGPNDEILIGRSLSDDWNAGIKSIESISIDSGESKQVFSSLHDIVRVRSFEYSPDGKILGLAYSTRRDQELTKLTIIRDALGQ